MRVEIGAFAFYRREKMKVVIEKNELVIRIPLQKPTPSKTGRTLIVASSGGNIATTATVDGKPVIVGLNAYIK
jgi:hypothetical protein